MRKIIITLLATIIAAAGLAFTAGPASADPGSPKCITYKEWKKIKKGMTRVQVKKITGLNGKVTAQLESSGSGITQIAVDYKLCKGKKSKKPASYSTTMWYATERIYDAEDYVIGLTTVKTLNDKGMWFSF